MTTEELHEAIKNLREDLRRIDYAIASVEGVVEGRVPRGRPPKFLGGEPAEIGERRPRRRARRPPEPPAESAL